MILPWPKLFCRAKMILPWLKGFCLDEKDFAVTVVGHRSIRTGTACFALCAGWFKRGNTAVRMRWYLLTTTFTTGFVQI